MKTNGTKQTSEYGGFYTSLVLQDAGSAVVESVFPSVGEAKLTSAQIRRNLKIMTALKSGQTNNDVLYWALVTGSRAEGLALDTGWGHGSPDLDTLFIYGALWTVCIPVTPGTMAAVASHSHLEMVSVGCPPCFCRVRVLSNIQNMTSDVGQEVARGGRTPMDLFETVIQFMGHEHSLTWSLVCGALRMIPSDEDISERWYSALDSIGKTLPQSLNFLLPWSVGESRARTIFTEQDGLNYLSSSGVQKLLSDHSEYGSQQGPSQQVRNRDLVPALICSQPFPCIRAFLKRHEDRHLDPHRATDWPPDQVLTDIRVMPGIIVPTGNAGSIEQERQMQWRFSFSAQELLLSQHMPAWVKAGYRAFKYTVKAMCKQTPRTTGTNHGENDSRKSLCTFHMKTILLWTFEDADTWDNCSFRLMIRLLIRLDVCVFSGTLPHYFNPACNLLQFVQLDEQQFVRSCLNSILQDPVGAMVRSPTHLSGLLGTWGYMASYFAPSILDEKHKRYRVALAATGL